MNNFGAPPETRKPRPMFSLLVKIGEKGTTAGGKMKPVALDYFKIGEETKQGFMEHPAFKGDNPKKITIELISDDPREMMTDSLECFTGKKRFCYNRSGGKQAMRLDKNGGYSPVECDTTACPFFQKNHEEILGSVQAQYPYAPLGSKYTDGKGKVQYACSTCKRSTYFFFHIVNPEAPEELLTKSGGVARFYTTSPNSADQIMYGLADLWQKMGGALAGLRVNLVVHMIKNPQFDNLVPTVAIEGPTSPQEIVEAFKDMALRRGMRSINAQKAMEVLSGKTREELDAMDIEYIFKTFVQTDPALESNECPALPLPEPAPPIAFATENPLCKSLIQRMKLDYAIVTRLQVDYQDDADSLSRYLLRQADKNDVDILDICERYDVRPPKKKEPPKEVQPEPPSVADRLADREGIKS